MIPLNVLKVKRAPEYFLFSSEIIVLSIKFHSTTPVFASHVHHM